MPRPRRRPSSRPSLAAHYPRPSPAGPHGHRRRPRPAPRSPLRAQPVPIETAGVAHATGKALVVTVAGEIDLFTVDRFRGAVAAGFEDLRDGEILVIDLTEVTFLASQGLQALVDATQAAQQWREPLRIVVDHTRPVIRPIQVTGLDD